MDKALSFKIGADIADLKAKMDEAHGFMHSFKEQIGEIATGMVAAFSVEKVLEWGKASVEAAAEAVDNENRLLFALKGRKDIQEELLTSAEHLSRTTLFDDDEIIKQQSLLAVMGRNKDQITSIIAAAADFKTALGPDVGLGQVVEALNKALEGNNKALFALDPTLRNVTELTNGHGDAVAYVMEKYKGFAEAATAEGTGPIKMLEKAWDDFGKTIGRVALPMIVPGLQAVTKELNYLTEEKVSLWTKAYSVWSFLTTGRTLIPKEPEAPGPPTGSGSSMYPGQLPDIDIVAHRIETIRSIQEKITDLKTKELDQSGAQLSNTQAQIVAENQKLEALKNQYAIQQDAADSARLTGGGGPGVTMPGVHIPDIHLGLSGGISTKVAASKTDTTSISYLKALSAATDDTTQSVTNMSNAYTSFAEISGAAIGGAVSGHKDFAQSLMQMVPKIVGALGALAIASITAEATNPENNGGNYYVAVGLIAAGVALVASIFSGLDGGGTVASKGAAGAGGGPRDASWTSGKVITGTLGDRLMMDVKFQPINGTQLQAILVNQTRVDNKVKGG